MHEERQALARLAHLPGIGGRELVALAERFGSAAAIVAASRAELAAAGLSQPAIAAILSPEGDRLEPILSWMEAADHHLVGAHTDTYPPLLADIADPPAVLYVKGDPALLRFPQLAVVGSRNPTRGGEATARDFAAHLAGNGLVITSGLALGIDAAAHRGALAAGGGTVAVLGTGVDRIYPAANATLARRIAERGALVSELPLGSPPRRDHFPRRNRILSGLALGTLVVEAARRSGSLITARLAGEQGREVFAIPGSIHNPMARGTHLLIREGAKLVETAADIYAELAPLAGTLLPAAQPEGRGKRAEETSTGLDPDYEKLLEAMGWEPVDPDAIAARAQLTIEEVSSMLLILELQGHVESLPGGAYSRVGREHHPE